jgi:hypothetical protein
MLSSPTYIDHGHGNSPVYYSTAVQQTNPVRVFSFFFFALSILLCKERERERERKSYNTLKRRFSYSFCICHCILWCSFVSQMNYGLNARPNVLLNI